MKKSITFLASALLAAGTAFAGNSVSDSVTATTSKYVVFADPKLIESELGELKKTSPALPEIIEEDRKITEAAPVPYTCLPKQSAFPAPEFKN